MLKVAQLGRDSTHTGGWDARPEFLAPWGVTWASLLASFTHIGLSAALRNLLLKCKAVLQLCFVKA